MDRTVRENADLSADPRQSDVSGILLSCRITAYQCKIDSGCNKTPISRGTHLPLNQSRDNPQPRALNWHRAALGTGRGARPPPPPAGPNRTCGRSTSEAGPPHAVSRVFMHYYRIRGSLCIFIESVVFLGIFIGPRCAPSSAAGGIDPHLRA